MSRKAKRLVLSLLTTAMMLFLIQSLVSNSKAAPTSSARVSNAATDGVNDAIQHLVESTNGSASVSLNRATGVARFVSWPAGSLALPVNDAATAEEKAAAFFNEYGGVFGITDASVELSLVNSKSDHLNTTHLTYQQIYQGVEVFAGILRVHFDRNNDITAVNGVFIPHIAISPTPLISEDNAANTAVNAVNEQLDAPAELPSLGASMLESVAPVTAVNSALYVYRDGLLQGIGGANYLVYEVEVSNSLDIREFVYVDAHKGTVVNQISAIHQALDRRIYNGDFGPAFLVWQEGDPLPYTGGGTVTETMEINGLINFTEDSYDFFFNTFGYDSWDGAGGIMHAVYDAPISCPNASWNGTSTNYCPGVAGDDTVAHEWGHAYTDSTHDLIYQWQSGALNESYSDIWGEVVDLINGEGTDSPAGPRSDNACTVYTPPVPQLVVNTPPIAGSYPAGPASFGPSLADTGPITGDVVVVDDGSADPTLGCNPLVNGAEVAGNIAFIRRGTCNFTVKVKNAQDAGAIAAIVANHEAGGDTVMTMGGADPSITIPSVFIGYSNGNTIEAAAATGVNVTLDSSAAGGEDSYRWLQGEDDWALGIIRDMWNPSCLSDPGKVSDTAYYVCSTDDGGGVHTNSGIPNHAFALLVDGGSYNGQSVGAIGAVKASHIYWRAQNEYQTPSSDFADHADALEQSCTDLVGVDLTGFDGNPSGEIIDADDCAQVSNAMLAVEMRDEPTFCAFEPLLDTPAPPVCTDPTESPFYSENFDVEPPGWTVSNTGVFTEYVPLDWQYVTALPDGRTGGYFGPDPIDVGDCIPGSDDQSGVRYLDSPPITVPTVDPGDNLILTFEHYVATEFGWDGGNVWINVNGGGWQLIPSADFLFNPYNTTLQTAAAGNTNPLAGMEAFSGSNEGEVAGSWGQSQVDVTGYAVPGDTVQVRFALGVDGCNGLDGWYIDQVSAYACSSSANPNITLAVDGSTSDLEVVTSLLQGQFERHMLEITNTGLNDLVWSIDEEPTAQGVEPENVTPAEEPGGRLRDADSLSEAAANQAASGSGEQPSAAPMVDVVQDSSFELGSPNPYWNEYVLPTSDVPVGPICNTALCGISFPHTGDGHLWYGGFGPGVAYGGGVTQTVTLANTGDAQLSLWLWWPDGTGPDDVFVASVDSTPVFTVTAATSGPYNADYAEAVIDISAFADGGSHVLGLEGFVADGASILVDDVTINDHQPCADLADVPWLAVLQTNGVTAYNSSTQVPVIVDSTGLAPGIYTANLCITSNAPANPLLIVPVTIEVMHTFYMPVLAKP